VLHNQNKTKNQVMENKTVNVYVSHIHLACLLRERFNQQKNLFGEPKIKVFHSIKNGLISSEKQIKVAFSSHTWDRLPISHNDTYQGEKMDYIFISTSSPRLFSFYDHIDQRKLTARYGGYANGNTESYTYNEETSGRGKFYFSFLSENIFQPRCHVEIRVLLDILKPYRDKNTKIILFECKKSKMNCSHYEYFDGMKLVDDPEDPNSPYFGDVDGFEEFVVVCDNCGEDIVTDCWYCKNNKGDFIEQDKNCQHCRGFAEHNKKLITEYTTYEGINHLVNKYFHEFLAY
jgi:hypothetical protein